MLVSLGYKKMELQQGVTIMVKQLNVEAYQKLISVISTFAKSQNEDMTEQQVMLNGLEQMSNTEVVRIAKEIIPAHCKDLEGIDLEDDSDGETKIRTATVSDLFEIGALLPFVVAIIFELFRISSISEDDTKKLKKQ